jgi:hypothetical protein
MAKPNYSELASLSLSGTFRDRVAIAVAFYARYVINENPATPLHNSRASWAKQAFLNPAAVASQIAPAVAIDSIFADQDPLDFDGTPDSGAGSVQAAVEATINSTVLAF